MFPSSVLLAVGGLDPDEVARACRLDRVDQVMVKPAPGWFERLWIGGVAAVTLPWAIYVRRSVLYGDHQRLAHLLVHELVHVRQWGELGPLRFVWRYLREYAAGRLRGLSHRDAYLGISLEREARSV